MSLQTNDLILIVSPAGRVLKSHIDNAVGILKSWGLRVELGKYVCSEHHNFAGTIEQRLEDLQWALDHSTAKAIFCSRGGYGIIQLLDKIDWAKFKKNPKLLIGYSDVTNLQVQINNLGISSLHALMPNSFPRNGEHHESIVSLKKALFDKQYKLSWESEISIFDQEIEGEIVGGNLSIIYSLQGTPYVLNTKDKILFIEDVSEYLYNIDRMLRSVELSNKYIDIRAIIVGDFTDIKDNERPFGVSIQEMLVNIGKRNNIPVIFGLKTGHGDPTLALPLGQKTYITIKDNICTLKF